MTRRRIGESSEESTNLSNKDILSSFFINSSEEEIKKSSNQAVSLSTAGIRALVYQLQALYLRTPVKLFRPSRFDYLAYVRAMADKHDDLSLKPWRFTTHSSLAMLINTIKKEGWKFIPDQILPPLLANSATGIILYSSYLTALDYYDKNRDKNVKAKIKGEFNYSPVDTWRAGFIAGIAQSLAAAPIDAIYARSTTSEIINGNHQNLWIYGYKKLQEIGFSGVFAGYGFSLIKESIGFAFYFSTFELVKNQAYGLTFNSIIIYRKFKRYLRQKFANIGYYEIDEELINLEEKRLTKILRSTFVLLAGASAAFSLLAVQYPITKIQNLHLSRLETLDIYNSSRRVKKPFVKVYYNSYIDTYHQVRKIKSKSKLTWFELSYKGFVRNALSTIPATSIGLLVFEIMRTRLADSIDYDQLL